MTATVQRFTRSVDRLASPHLLIGSGIVLFVFGVLLFATSAPFSIPSVERVCATAPPDVRFYSSATDVEQFLEDCGRTGRQAYRNLQIADLAYPTVFGVFMASSLAIALKRVFPTHPSRSNLAALALVGVVFDYTENAFAWRALAAFPDGTTSNSLLGIASAAKTTTFWFAGLILLASLFTLTLRALRQRLPKTKPAAVVPLD